MQTRKTVSFPDALGFREGATSVHTSRTMMLEELVQFLLHNTIGAWWCAQKVDEGPRQGTAAGQGRIPLVLERR